MLDAAQQAQAWQALQNSLLMAKWPDFREFYLPRLTQVAIPANGWVFQVGDLADYFYFVGEGSIRQTVRRDGQVWLQQDLGPAAHFGQQALFADRQQSGAQAAVPTTLYRMAPADLRLAMERNLDLYELLLRERLATRLRRIPLLRDLTDAQVRWLAQVFEELDFAPGAGLPLADKPGLWIIDWGQVEVSGAASLGRPDWRLTAGAFFFAQGAGLRFGANCTADSAKARLKTHLFYLPARHADRLIASFSEMAPLLQRPLDIVPLLAGVELFARLTDEQRRSLAQLCAWEFVPAQQNITTQGNIGHSFVYLRDGAALVTALDDRGRPRPRNYLAAGDSYGETSLLQGRVRDATVRAVKAQDQPGRPGLAGADLIILDRRDLQHTFRDEPRLWPRTVELVGRSEELKAQRQPFSWMSEGESLRLHDRGHFFWILFPETGVLAAGLLMLLFVLLAPADFRPILSVASVIFGAVLVLVGVWLLFNYLDDYYVVTNRRVTRRDRLLLMYEARVEAPIETVQDVNIDTNFWGRLFDYGDVTVRTAAKIGAIKFEHIPHPDAVKSAILQEKTEALAAQRSQAKETLRRGLISELRMALPIPERKRALGEDVESSARRTWRQRLRRWFQPNPQRPEILPGVRRKGKPGWFMALARRFPQQWQKVLIGAPPPPPRPLSGQFLWRKHWLNLLQRAGAPLLAVLALIGAMAILIWLDVHQRGFEWPALLLPWLLLFVLSAGWLAWQYIDYHNDIYVVTDEKIIDIERKPLGLAEKRLEGSLERVQNVVAVQKGFWAMIFSYGDVLISTAAAGEGYTFNMVPNPKLVQSVVFQKLDALRTKQEMQRSRERQQELVEGLEVYDQLKRSGLGG
jgi:CRP-like cAMP-binding protein/membrane protein YdbS with pleckstrin-like domain